MLPPQHPYRRAQRRRAATTARTGGFSPVEIVTAWYRLAASTAVSSEWETVVDVLGGSPLTQTDADRKLAVSAAANGLPTGTYDGTDCIRMPLGANNFSTSKMGLAYWLKPTTLGTGQTLFAIFNNDAALRSWVMRQLSGALLLDVYIGSNVDGRTYTAAAALTTDVWQFVRIQLDMTKTNECDTTGADTDAKVRVFVGETAIALTAGNIGAGGTLTALRSPTGSAIFGGLNDSDTPASPTVAGTIHGPNTYILLNTPTAAQAANLKNFEQPT